MIGLIIVAALLATGCVWFLLRPLAHKSIATQEGRHQLVQLRDRLLAQLRELDLEERDANVDAKVAAEERARLEAELAQALKELEVAAPAVDSTTVTPTRVRRAVVIALALLLPLGSAVLYVASNRITLARLSHPAETQTATMEVPPQVQEMVGRLERRLKEQPNDARGWAMLGRSYEVLHRTEDARQAYAQAHRVAPQDAEILAAYASFLASLNPSSPSPETIALFRKLHALDPRHPAALWTLGLASFQARKFSEAVNYWERLRKELPADNEVTPQIERAIQAARAEAAQGKKSN